MGSEIHIHTMFDVAPIAIEGAPVNEESSPGAAQTKVIARIEGYHVVRMGDRITLGIKTAHRPLLRCRRPRGRRRLRVKRAR